MSERPKSISGVTETIKTPVGRLFMTINCHEGAIYEVFLTIGKAGVDVRADAEAIGRLLTQLFRRGFTIDEAIHQLNGIGGSGVVNHDDGDIRSLPDGVARILQRYDEDREV